MTAAPHTEAAGGVQLVGTLGRPARPERPAGYWARVDAIVDAAPRLSDSQRAVIRSAFHTPAIKEAA